ncbi:glycosyltransferase [Angustibacter sp. Root456]|uniref:glycosyltransferase family protein n=1 Tax=Angustibacter sp. Root456 TaxID=1736539 RepID=UPI0006FA7416|nr:glycosyltransferase [Angustibacter sp. Root456]KQX61961.1 hypothetical protein ASD06_15630 [Angustibacter sp. Root456]
MGAAAAADGLRLANRLSTDMSQQWVRRAQYEALIRGEHSNGPRGRITFCVYTCDLDEGRGDVYVAAGLGLALVELGFGIVLVPRNQWNALEPTSLVVAMLPTFEPSVVPHGTPVIAWVRNETDRWCASGKLIAYDRVIASSALALRELARWTPAAAGVLPIGVDTQLFTLPPEDQLRVPTAVTTAHFWGSVRNVHQALIDLADDADVVMIGNAAGAPARLGRWHRPSVPYFSLPLIYAQTRLVIDDMNPTTVGYGSLNSRFFESAACGALPVMNGILGIRELGLPEVPHYTDAESLSARLAERRADPDGTRAMANHLATVVRRDHSWQARATAFCDVLGDLIDGEAPDSVAPRQALHFFPDYRAGNPYQAMLYEALGTVGAHPVPVPDVIQHLKNVLAGDASPGILHIHWTGPILQWARGPFRAKQVLDLFSDLLRQFKMRGGKLVWTVHNVLPHDANHRWAEIQLARLLAEHADRIHVLSSATLDAVRPYYDLPAERVRVVEHSSYEGIYPLWISKAAARERLGIAAHDRAIIALGGIRPYKGLSRLLTIFERLSKTDPTLRLLVAGKPGRFPGVVELQQLCEAHPRIVSRFEHVPDDQLQVWMTAADLAVLPYAGILNSGALLLAQTFGLPVVAPRTGAVRDLESSLPMQTFELRDDDSLAEALQAALQRFTASPENARHAREQARGFSRAQTPLKMAEGFATSVVAELLTEQAFEQDRLTT